MIRNTKIAITLAIAAGALLPVAAQAKETFSRNGVDYAYEVSQVKDRKIITGTADRVPFRLVVRGRRVSGEYGSSPVSFSLSEVKTPREAVAVR
jgi:hypothetical protein